MSLTIPLAMVADMMIHGRHYSAIYVLGSIQVNDHIQKTLVRLSDRSRFVNMITSGIFEISSVF